MVAAAAECVRLGVEVGVAMVEVGPEVVMGMVVRARARAPASGGNGSTKPGRGRLEGSLEVVIAGIVLVSSTLAVETVAARVAVTMLLAPE